MKDVERKDIDITMRKIRRTLRFYTYENSQKILKELSDILTFEKLEKGDK